MAEFSELLGKYIENIEQSKEQIVFYLTNGAVYRQYHSQDCCEQVSVEDIVGDLDDLIGSKILMADESTYSGSGYVDNNSDDDDDGSHTWTFYKLATKKGYVTIRWFGSSNGYYSEGVDFEKIKEEDPIREQRKKKLNKINKNGKENI